jgi:pimeloyl-ACP methyl ester carboxylesterase
VSLSWRGAILARLGIVGFALRLLTSGSRTVPKLLARLSAGQGRSVTERLTTEVAKMPKELWPAIAQHWSKPRSFRAMAAALENLPVSVNQLDEQRTLGDLPVIVLSAPTASPAALAEHIRDSGLSSSGQHVLVPDAAHWVQLDAPDVVVAAIARVVRIVRGRPRC